LIQLLKLEDRPEVIEVPFSQAYNEAIRKLHGLNVSGYGTKSSKPGKTSMNALASVAAAGVATISINGVADKLLSITQLPRVPRRSKAWGVVPSQLEWCFQQENAGGVILFDLLCIGCRTWEMCNNMVDIIKSHLNVPKTVKDSKTMEQGYTLRKGSGEDSKRSSRTDLKLKSLNDVLRQFEKLLQLGADIEGSSQQNVLIALYKHSIQTFLQTATLSLSSEDCKTYACFVSEMKKCVDRVENAILFTQGADNIQNQRKESPNPSPKKNEMISRYASSKSCCDPRKISDSNCRRNTSRFESKQSITLFMTHRGLFRYEIYNKVIHKALDFIEGVYSISTVCCHLFVVGGLRTSMIRIAMLAGVLYS